MPSVSKYSVFISLPSLERVVVVFTIATSKTSLIFSLPSASKNLVVFTVVSPFISISEVERAIPSAGSNFNLPSLPYSSSKVTIPESLYSKTYLANPFPSSFSFPFASLNSVKILFPFLS